MIKMVRLKRVRRIFFQLSAAYFQPTEIPMIRLNEIGKHSCGKIIKIKRAILR